jgi:DNA-directed RNA polymerase specialized sigma24 family protein
MAIHPKEKHSVSMTDVGTLRELLRNYRAFRAAYESDGLDSITGPDGTIYCLHDLTYLISQLDRLSPRQRQSIYLCLLNNVKEVDAARIMGVSETNPVAMYATLGLKRLVEMIRAGELNRYREDNLV